MLSVPSFRRRQALRAHNERARCGAVLATRPLRVATSGCTGQTRQRGQSNPYPTAILVEDGNNEQHSRTVGTTIIPRRGLAVKGLTTWCAFPQPVRIFGETVEEAQRIFIHLIHWGFVSWCFIELLV